MKPLPGMTETPEPLNSNDLASIIDIHGKDRFSDHLKYFTGRKKSIMGEVKADQITIWKYTPMTGFFYTVYTFQKNEAGQWLLKRDKLNPVAKIAFLLFSLGVLYPMVPKSTNGFSTPSLLIIACIILVYFSLFFLLFRWIRRSERTNFLEDLSTTLGPTFVFQRDRKRENAQFKWLRLFTYPFCFFLIWMVFALDLIKESIGYSLLVLGIILVYLATDLAVLFKRN